MEPLVIEIMQLIDARADDPRLQWSPDRMTVRVLYSKLILARQLRTDARERRSRFADAWLAAMAEHGWRPAGPPGLFTLAPTQGVSRTHAAEVKKGVAKATPDQH
jgi:hypothetical protein